MAFELILENVYLSVMLAFTDNLVVYFMMYQEQAYILNE